MDVRTRVIDLVAPLLDDLDVELVDLEISGAGRSRFVRLYVDRAEGVDLELIAQVSQEVSRTLDAHDPIAGAYTLEVSSPGVERPLRTPDHFRRVVGETVSVKTHEPVDEERRHRGVLAAVDDDGVTVELDDEEGTRHLRFDQVEKARTVFEWGPAPKPGSTRKNPKSGKKSGNEPQKKSKKNTSKKNTSNTPEGASTGSEAKV